MYRGPRIAAFHLLILGICSGLSPAQYSAGDAIHFGANGSFLRVTRQGVVATAGPSLCCSVLPFMVAPDNRSIWYLATQKQPPQGRHLYRLAPDGSTALILQNAALGGTARTDLTGNGHLITTGGGGILKGTVSSGFTTLYAGSPLVSVQAGCIDLQSGDFIALDIMGIYRISVYGQPRVTSMAKWFFGTTGLLGLHFDPESGSLVGAWNSAIHRITLGPTASVSTLFSQSSWLWPISLDRDPWDGQFAVFAWDSIAGRPGVFRFDARSRAITTLALLPPYPGPLPPGTFDAGPVIAGSRHLWPGSEARPGQTYRLMVSSPNEPGASYVIALSLGFRPGIPVPGGRKIYLNPDPLFFYSLTNSGIFSGFRGGLNPRGEAPASVAIPNHPGLSGLRFFASAVTIVNHQISVISEPLGVTIQ